MTAALVDVKTKNHKWKSSYTKLGSDSASGCEETWGECEKCSVIKVTVHAPTGESWREWRHPSGHQFPMTATPPCLAGEVG